MPGSATHFSRSKRRKSPRKDLTALGLIFFLLLILAIAMTRTWHMLHWSGR
jgi:hypothetical protein